MKNLTLTLLLVLMLAFPIMSKTVDIRINNQTYILTIEDNTNDSEQQIIDLFTAYIETRDNLEKTKKLLATTQTQLNENINSLDSLLAENKKLLELIDKRPSKSVIIFRPNVKVGMSVDLDKHINSDIGMGVLLWEWVDVGMMVSFPEPISIGLFISIYLK